LQAIQALPSDPQALGRLPDWHLPVESQQPTEQLRESQRCATVPHDAAKKTNEPPTTIENQNRRMTLFPNGEGGVTDSRPATSSEGAHLTRSRLAALG